MSSLLGREAGPDEVVDLDNHALSGAAEHDKLKLYAVVEVVRCPNAQDPAQQAVIKGGIRLTWLTTAPMPKGSPLAVRRPASWCAGARR